MLARMLQEPRRGIQAQELQQAALPRALAVLVQEALTEAGLPADAVQLVATTDRAAVGLLIGNPAFVDVIIPRGGKGLIERISRDAKVPVIKHLDGNCHVYVDEFADPAKALAIVENAKTQRYGTCNTTESLLVDAAVASAQLPAIGAMLAGKGVRVLGERGDRTMLPSLAGLAAKGRPARSISCM